MINKELPPPRHLESSLTAASSPASIAASSGVAPAPSRTSSATREERCGGGGEDSDDSDARVVPRETTADRSRETRRAGTARPGTTNRGPNRTDLEWRARLAPRVVVVAVRRADPAAAATTTTGEPLRQELARVERAVRGGGVQRARAACGPLVGVAPRGVGAARERLEHPVHVVRRRRREEPPPPVVARALRDERGRRGRGRRRRGGARER